MKFGTVPGEGSAGASLAHGVRAGDMRLKKGRRLNAADVALLEQSGIARVTVARLEAGDVGEDVAAKRIASGCGGDGVRIGAAFTGRVNLYATTDGIAVINPHTVAALNAIDESVTLATVAPYARVLKGQMLATIKIIPFAASRESVEAAEALLASQGALLRVSAFQPRK